MSPSVMNLREAARFIRVSEKTLGDMAREQRIPAQKVGREWRFFKGALESWLSAGAAPASRPYPAGKTKPELNTAEPLVQYELKFSGLRDTAFTENRKRALHRWVPWIAGFSSPFVADVLQKIAGTGRRRLRVLDPFSGVGTTLVEALKHGHDAFGFEINPYAALACKAKVNAASYDVPMLKEQIAAFLDYMAKNEDPEAQVPQGFSSRVPFFSPDVQRQVLVCLDFIETQRHEWVRDLFRVALGSVMVGFSNYSYEPSLGTRAAAGKRNIEQADVARTVAGKLGEMLEDLSYFQGVTEAFEPKPRAEVFHGSFFDLSDRIAPHSIDALITSPPYLNNYHYIRNTRPQMFWLGMTEIPGDLKEMERKSFGQFWQTVRSGPPIALEPAIPALVELIDELKKQNPDRGDYGGTGWANYAATYFNDCARFCRTAFALMRPGGTAVVVIGNNILQGIEFATDVFFAELAQQAGFEVVEMHEVRKKRTGNSIINSSVRVGAPRQRTPLYEVAVELRTPRPGAGSSG